MERRKRSVIQQWTAILELYPCRVCPIFIIIHFSICFRSFFAAKGEPEKIRPLFGNVRLQTLILIYNSYCFERNFFLCSSKQSFSGKKKTFAAWKFGKIYVTLKMLSKQWNSLEMFYIVFWQYYIKHIYTLIWSNVKPAHTVTSCLCRAHHQ